MSLMQALYSWLWRLVPGNPQVVRIVQGASRRNQHALVRLSYLLILMGIVFVGLIGGGGVGGSGDLGELAQAGAQIFRIVANGQVILVCLIAPVFMAGAIASEQSGKTYNILLTTPLSNLQIVLGSLIGRLFFILALLLSGLPLFAVMLIFGGVPVSSIFIAFAVAALTALFVGAVAVLLSVMRAGGRKAVFTFVISVAAYLVVVGALDMVVLRQLGPANTTTVLTPVHPLLVLEASINRANYAPPGPEQLTAYPALVRFYLGQPFATFATLTAGGSLLMILYCSLWVRRIGAGDGRLMIWVKKKLRLAGAGRRRKARDLGTGNPIAWREANTRGKLAGGILARYGFVVLGLAALGLLMFFYHYDPSFAPKLGADGKPLVVQSTPSNDAATDWFRPSLTALLITEIAVITLVALYMAAGSVSKEREDGTLDIMLTTPITPKYYIWGKLRGLVRFLSIMIALPVATLAIVGVYALIGRTLGWPQATVMQQSQVSSGWGGGVSGGAKVQAPLVYIESAIVLLVMLVPFISVCVAIGMYSSLRAKGVLGAIIPSIAIVGGGALVFGFCGLTASSEVPLIGPVLNGFSPATNVFMLVDPHAWVEGFTDEPIFGRVSIGIAAIIAASGYALIVWSVITAMVKGFDHTVRRLSGTK